MTRTTSDRGGPLAIPNFRLYAGCDLISTSGSAVAVVALPFAVLDNHGTAADIGYVTTANLALMAVFFLVGGVLSDRLPRARVMVCGNAVQAAAQIGSAVLLLSGTAATWSLAVFAALRGVGVGIYFPAATGLVAQLVPVAQLGRANAISRASRSTAQILGTGLGGVLVSVVGPGWGLAIDGVSYVVAGAMRAGMRIAPGPPVPGRSVLQELKEGWTEFVGRRWVWTGVLEFAVVAAAYQAAFGVLGPVVADASYGGAWGWGWITAASSAGAVFGGLAMLRFPLRRLLFTGSLALLVMSVFMFAMAAPSPIALVLLGSGIAGVCREVFTINWSTALQSEIPHAVLSRISAYDSLGSYLLSPVGGAVAGPLADHFGARPILVCCGIVTVVVTGAVLCLPEVRGLQLPSSPTVKRASAGPE